MTYDRNFKFLRRSFLAGVGASAAANLVRPLWTQAQEATGAPQRILMVHRPCGTRTDLWWPNGGKTDFTLSPLLKSFEALRQDMVVLKGVDCPRRNEWIGDKHGAGMIAMTSPPPKDRDDTKVWPLLPGYTEEQQSDTNMKLFTALDMSIEQRLLRQIPALQLGKIPSVQLTASVESADSKADSCLRVVSYSKPDPNAAYPTALWPEVRPDAAFNNIFGSGLMNLTDEQMARVRNQNKSVLDYIVGDLGLLKSQVPSSQVTKIDQHLTAVRDLEKNLTATGTGRMCMPASVHALPTDLGGMPLFDASHYQVTLDMMQIIKTMFECDLTRVASFTFGYGNSGIHFKNIMKRVASGDVVLDLDGNPISDTEGHHDVSHNGGDKFSEAQYIVDKFYCNMLAKLLLDMKNTEDGATGGSLLDNTLVVFWNECSNGNEHATNDMPALVFGGKFLDLQGGQYLQYGNHARTMADLWVTTAQRWGDKKLTQYGDAMWNKGSLSGLYG